MIDEIKSAESRMASSVDNFKAELSKLRSGRAHPSIIEHLRVEYYGDTVPLSQVASITVDDARTLALSVWDKSALSAVEKAILSSDLGLNPVVAGTSIKIPLPPLTQERRAELVKVSKQVAESARVAIRNIRREFNNNFRQQAKEKLITEDDERQLSQRLQKLTDEQIRQIEALLETKEKELMDF
ncbi:MAG: ribosome recycling factor [Legionellales bacterium]|nr:ribosome recycling factor [Legionellales bacterium]|tara:strand:+ start:421 stop:975 length:555 start_codon:yes stop_codon:yes gene_type:complete